jgi:hypothetical protein
MDNYNIAIDKEDTKMILNAQTPIFLVAEHGAIGCNTCGNWIFVLDYYWFHHHLLVTFTFL